MGEEDEDADTLGVRRGVRIRRDARGGSASSDMTPNYSLQIYGNGRGKGGRRIYIKHQYKHFVFQMVKTLTSFSPFRLQTVSAGLEGWAGHKCGRKSPKEGRLR